MSLAHRRWLEAEVASWRADSIVSEEQARAIVARYETTAALRELQTHRLFLALCGLAALLCGAGVLLLIGYNWDGISREVKVGLIYACVIGAFAGAAVAYSKKRLLLGEILAFLATLLFGSAIWLLAQVFHIQAHYPDGILWWGVGSLVTACLVGSRLVGFEAATLFAVWACNEAGGFENPAYLYALLAVVLGILAYRLESLVLLTLVLAGSMVWWLCLGVGPWGEHEGTAPLLVLLGIAYFVAGRLHRDGSPFGRVWEVLGLTAVLSGLLPLTFTDFQDVRWGTDPELGLLGMLARPGVIAALVLAAAIAAGVARRARSVLEEGWPLLVVALCTLGHFLVLRLTEPPDDLALAAAVLFSALSVLLSIWLIVRGVRFESAPSFFAGVAYFLVFLIVRWFDLIGDMVSSAILFFIAAGVLFATAWYWKRRRRAHGGSSSGEVRHESA